MSTRATAGQDAALVLHYSLNGATAEPVGDDAPAQRGDVVLRAKGLGVCAEETLAT
ncbi:MAG: hypothetical protein ACI8W7_002492 [Gammaproteobacteria bacterium]